jgi:predicted permease
MWHDLVFGLRQLARYRTTSALVILLLAVGLGANTLVFSLVNELMLKPLPVTNPENLFLLEKNRQLQVRPDTFFTYEIYRDRVAKSPLVAAAVAEQEWYEADQLPMRSGSSALVRVVIAQMVSPNYFTELGVRPYLGRLLTPSDAEASGTLPAVLSYQFWQSEFGGDRAVVGRTIRLKYVPFVIVGVLPREFHSSDIDRAPDVRLPVSASLLLHGKDVADAGAEGLPTFRVLLRLKPGVSPERAAAALLEPMQDLEEWSLRQFYAKHKELPAANIAHDLERNKYYRLAAVPMLHGASQLRDQFANALHLLLGGVVLLLVAVCANVAGLLLAKSNQRRKEMGIRLAVGAGRWQLMRQLLTEHLLLALGGGLAGAALAYALAPALVGLLPAPRDFAQLGSPLILRLTPDLRVLAVLALLTLACVVAFGLLPAWRASRVSLVWELKIARGQAPAGRAAVMPVAVQVAFSVVLLSAAGLMLRTFCNLEQLNAGFDREHVIEMTPDPDALGYKPPQISAFYRTLRDKAAALSGVASAALASRGVMRGVGIKMTLAPEGVTLPANTFLNTSSNNVSPGYFATMGIAFLEGRDLTVEDAAQQPLPAVVNRAFAESFFPQQDPIGKMVVQGTDGKLKPGFVIVGLVATAKYRSLREPDPPTIYTALDEKTVPLGGSLLYVRTRGAPAEIGGALRQTLAAIDPAVPLREMVTLDREVETSLWQERLVAILSAFFGGAAALLAAIGLYGSLASSVVQRRREIGIRVAVGARLLHIVRALCSPVALAVALGVALGLTAWAFLLRLTARLLYGVQPWDPLSVALALVFLCLCAAAAAVPPARRAGRIDPASALREE